MNQTELKKTRQKRRRQSVRRRLSTSGPSQRLSVHRTSKHIYAQIVDDVTGRTLCGVASTGSSTTGTPGSCGKRSAIKSMMATDPVMPIFTA